MGLQARGTAGVDSASTGGTWDISNADRLGKSEIELVNIFIEGVAQIIRWEQALEKGENIEAELKAVGLPKSITIEVKYIVLIFTIVTSSLGPVHLNPWNGAVNEF